MCGGCPWSGGGGIGGGIYAAVESGDYSFINSTSIVVSNVTATNNTAGGLIGCTQSLSVFLNRIDLFKSS
jgi:hypothetical protein